MHLLSHRFTRIVADLPVSCPKGPLFTVNSPLNGFIIANFELPVVFGRLIHVDIQQLPMVQKLCVAIPVLFLVVLVSFDMSELPRQWALECHFLNCKNEVKLGELGIDCVGHGGRVQKC